MEKPIYDAMNGLLTRMYRLQGYTQAIDRIRAELDALRAGGRVDQQGGEALAAVLLDLERRALQRMLALAAKGAELRRQLNLVKDTDPETTVTH